MQFTIAIDGPAAAGKGTISRMVCARFGFAHLDTGLLYRAVGARVLAGQEPLLAAQSLGADDLARTDLRSPDVAQAASVVAVNAQVRAALLTYQRNFARRAGGAVLDGRDIGTVICPQAEVKLYVTASSDVRAERRWAELVAKGLDISPEQVRADVIARDTRDAERDAAPMIAADDAVVLDTTHMSAEEAGALAIGVISAKFEP
uniref:Cytidylate kinase n=1 Tax=OCS116 cluster bacterium TaxID=2030921 RepID=A0A2A4YY94_9PROT